MKPKRGAVTAQLCEWGTETCSESILSEREGRDDHLWKYPQNHKGFFFKEQLVGAEQEEIKIVEG